MQFLQDHLAAVLVGGVVLLILASVQLTGREAAVDAVRFQAGRTSTDALAEVLVQDLANLGAGVAPGAPRIHARAGAGATTLFEFSGAVAPEAAAPVERVRYALVAADTAEVAVGATTHTLPTYELRRLVLDGGAWRLTARSPRTLVDFDVELLGPGGAPVGADLDAAETAVVRFVAVSPFSGGRRAGVTRWQRRVPLHNLAGA